MVEWKGGRREVNGKRENTVREEPCKSFGFVAAKSHFFTVCRLPYLAGPFRKCSHKKGILTSKNPFIITIYCYILLIARMAEIINF